ncbi:hypothetical protein L3V83_02445 [Thiotrichales bacterium 19X7-9]|nr:hypothetical protein [Thiotrichales bacterium 19X7-9]
MIIRVMFQIFFVAVSFLPLKVFADDTYTMTIKNNLNVPIKVETADVSCIEWVNLNQLGNDHQIQAQSTGSFQFRDDNDGFGGCWNSEKKLTFILTALIGDFEQQGKTYKLYARWKHKNKTPWQTIIYDDRANDPEKQLVIKKATCSNENCLNSYRDGGDPSYIEVGASDLASYQYILSSIQFGDVIIQDGLGAIVPVEPLSGAVDLDYEEKYFVKFTKSTNNCTIIEGMIYCPSSVEFLRDGKEIIFTCSQKEPGDAQCPWAINNDTVNNFDLDYL